MLKTLCAWLCCVGLVSAQSFDELLLQSEAKLRVHDASAALHLVDAAIKQDGGRWDGHFVRATALLKLGRASEALVSAEAAGSHAPADHKDAVQKLIDRCKTSTQGTRRVMLLLREADAAWNAGLDDLAARRYAEVFDIDPSQAHAGLMAAALWSGLEQYAAAGKLLRSLRESVDEKVRDQAVGLTQKIRSALAERVRADLIEATDALRVDQREVARNALARVAALTDDGEAHFLAAKLAAREGQLVDALQHLKTAKFARCVDVGMIWGDRDMALLSRDPSAAEWMRNAFGDQVVEALAPPVYPPAPPVSPPFTGTAGVGWAPKTGTSRALHHTFGDDGEVYVSQLGGALRGSLDIWRSEMGLPALDDKEFAALPKLPMLDAEGVLLDAAGNHQSMTGKKIDGARMLVAAQANGGSITFVKLVGNASEVKAQREAFLAFCASLRKTQ